MSGITQRDSNFYEHLIDSETQDLILSSVTQLWEKEVKQKWTTMDCKQSGAVNTSVTDGTHCQIRLT